MPTQFLLSEVEQDQKLTRLKSCFISTVSHELRTPLTTILSSADLLAHCSSCWSEEKKLQHLQRIQKAAIEMAKLLNSEEFAENMTDFANKIQEV